MDRRAFEALLAAEQFEQVTTVEREPNGSFDLHSHPFEAKALVIEGELSIRTADEERLYRAGEVFHLLADVPHSEVFGPAGVKYLVGRKQRRPAETSPG
jgi:quercetin dioxygenase-like cupin family protein